MLAAIVVVLNGAFLPSSPPVRRLFGHAMAPLAPVIARIADVVTLAGDDVTLVRGTRTCRFRIGSPVFACDAMRADAGVTPFARDGIVYLPLATVARAFGGSVTYDARSATLAIALPPRAGLATPAPFDPAAPQVAPTQIFTPQPGPPTPNPVDSGDPHPRRTALPATPSRVPGD
jgi:hypothetical protein